MLVQLLSRVQLFGTAWTHQTPLSMKFFWPEYWSGLPFPSPGDLPDPGTETVPLASSHWQAASYTYHKIHTQKPVQWFLACSQSCAAPQCSVRRGSHHTQENPIHVSGHSCFDPSSAPGNH